MRSAFVLGAGLGTRLLPLTAGLPKPLLPLFNKPLATFGMDLLIAAGFERFIVNTHHCPEEWMRSFGGDRFEAAYAGCALHFRHEPVLLETGGGLKNIEDLSCGGDLLVFNGDVLADLPLREAVAAHEQSTNAATLVLRSSGGPRQVRFDPGTGLVGDLRDALGTSRAPAFVFTGIYLVRPEVFAWLQPGETQSIVPVFLQMLRAGRKIGGIVIDSGLWMDLGNREAYLEAHRVLSRRPLSFPLNRPMLPVAPDAAIAPDAAMSGFVAVGSGCKVGAGARLHDSILWEGATVAAGADLNCCVVRRGEIGRGTAGNLDF